MSSVMFQLESQPDHGAPVDQQDVEWQFEATDLSAVERWLRDYAPTAALALFERGAFDIVDVYLDSEDWRFYRAGYSLRVRRLAEDASETPHFEATLKSLGERLDAIRHIREISEPMDGAGMDALRAAPGPVGQRLRLLAPSRPLFPLFEVHTRRKVFLLQRGGELLGEVALDDTAIPRVAGREPMRSRRVDVEAVEAMQPRLEAFVEALRHSCDLHAAEDSKYEAGLHARELLPIAIPDVGPRVVEADTPVGEAAFAVLRKHFGSWLAREPGTRLGEGPEDLHRMRVATRRLRAALGLFADVLPARRAAWLREELGWIGTELGSVRDLDVQLEHLRDWLAGTPASSRMALQPLEASLVQRREVAREKLLSQLNSERCERLVSVFTVVLQRGPMRLTPAGREPLVDSLPRRVAKRYRAMRHAGDHLRKRSAATELHALRIQCKRMRYAIESFADLYGKPAKRYVRRLTALQDVLGSRQDAAVARRYLEEFFEPLRREADAETLLAFESLAEHYEGQAAAARARFRSAYGDVTGKPWKRLRRSIRRRRSKAAAPAAPEPPAAETPAALPAPGGPPLGIVRP